MHRRIIGILVCMLLVATALPVAGTINGIKPRMEKENFTDSNEVLTATDGDWWPMFHHDLNNTGNSSSTAPDTNNVLWEYGTGGTVASSPAVVDGKVFVGSHDGNVYCLDESTGAWIWNYPTGGGVYSSPAVAGGKVYFGSKDGNLYCLDESTGAWIWNYPTGGGMVTSSPAVVEGKVFFGTMQPPFGYVYCLNALTGAFIWQHATMGLMVQSSPAVADGKVFVGSFSGNLYCLDASDGHEIWSRPAGSGGVLSSPAVADGKVYFGSYDNNVYCLDESTGAIIWQHLTADDVGSSPAVAGGKVYIGSFDNKVHCFGPENQPPEKPEITGPTIGAVGIEYEYSFYTTDPDEDDVYYYIEWGDGQTEEWIGSYNSGEIATVNHTWISPDDYEIRAKAKDTNDAESEWSDVYPVTIVENEPPNAPIIDGKTRGSAGTLYPYTFTSTDPNGDQVSYHIRWGDGDITDWTAFQDSGPPGYDESHTWDEQDEYTITAKAKDEFGLVGPEATLKVTMPRNKIVTYNSLVLWFLERFPILRLLLQR